MIKFWLMKFIIILLSLTLATPFARANKGDGKLLIIGGGSENITSTSSWNYGAFNWAVSQSANKKVAILHYSTTTTSAFENYFKTHCGANEVKSFIVNSTGANNATLIAEISEYDVFYLRGGDQWQYYNQWKGRLMEDAIHEKYSSGGVICGTSAGLAILSGTSFVAENGECYSNGAVKNTNLITITLRDDFLRMMPGFIFDSHYTNRGRLGRLVSFMAHWKKNKSESLVGIGVDEITALAINADGTATAYGAGTVSIIRERRGSDFASGSVLAIDSLEITQLAHGTSINLNTFEVNDFTSQIEPAFITETTPSKIYISGGDNLNSANEDLLEKFAVEGNKVDNIIVFTGSDASLAQSYKTKLNEFGAVNVQIFEASGGNSTSTEVASSIESTTKFLFVNNNAYNLITLFFNSGGVAGNALNNALSNRALYLAFIGDNARFCGEVLISNYINADANATLSDGLGLIKTATIIPKTFERPASGSVTTYWHGTNAAIPYAMVNEGIKNGIWLNDDNYIVFKGIGSKAKFTVYGSSPVFVQSLHNTNGDLVSQTYGGTGVPDKKAAYDFMFLSFLKENQEYILGNFESSLTGITDQPTNHSISIFPNPVTQKLNITSAKMVKGVTIYNMHGSMVFSGIYSTNVLSIDIERIALQSGIYLVEIKTTEKKPIPKKIIVK
jgi:cyanophycinase